MIFYRVSSYGATRESDDAVLLYRQVIHASTVRWKFAGSAQWDEHHGLYGISAPGVPYEAYRELEACLR